MIAFIIYETVDILYHVCKIGVNTTSTLYNWYTTPSTEAKPKSESESESQSQSQSEMKHSENENIEQVKQLLENKISVLLERIEKLEKEKLENKKNVLC